MEEHDEEKDAGSPESSMDPLKSSSRSMDAVT